MKKYTELWKLNPDQRLGQIFENFLLSKHSRGDGTSNELFRIEDDVCEERIDKTLNYIKQNIRGKK